MRFEWSLSQQSGLVFVFDEILVEILVEILFVVDLFLVFFGLIAILVGDLRFDLQIDPDFAELGFQKLEKLVDVVAAPLVQYVLEKLEQLPAIEAPLDLLHLFLREGVEDVLAE